MKSSQTVVLCNNAKSPKKISGKKLVLDYLAFGKSKPNIRIGLPSFIKGVYHLSDKILDLLEIACYVYSADRSTTRGDNSLVEYHSWARNFHFVIKVRDAKFWNRSDVNSKLCEALLFMTGDASYNFTFQAGHKTEPADLFDSEEFEIEKDENSEIVLFSGGLDSLTGAISILEETDKKVCLVSHQSGQPQTKKTQEGLYTALNKLYPNRLKYYRFSSGLKLRRDTEETQRSRSFLFTSIAFALSKAFKNDRFYIFENGVTSINLPRREDIKNSRASRTTHPKTVGLLKELFTLINEDPIEIRTPFFWNTKTDVLDKLRHLKREDLLVSSVSCSKTFQPIARGSHCGECYQCIDRRFAVFASILDDVDNSGLYNVDFVIDSITQSETRTGLIDYVYQASSFAKYKEGAFQRTYLTELIDILDYVDGTNDDSKIIELYKLCNKHGIQVERAIQQMRQKYDRPYETMCNGSLLHLISQREHLKEPLERFIKHVGEKLEYAIPTIFRKNPPKDENDLNDKIEGILKSEKDEFKREYPTVSFALCRTVPDHSHGTKLFIETKYLRSKTSPSKITDELGADIHKYPKETKILFALYDPTRRITDDVKFAHDIHNSDPRSTVLIIR